MSGNLISYPIENKSDYKAWALDQVLFRVEGGVALLHKWGVGGFIL